MEKVINDIYKKYPPVRLYKEDIKSLLDIFREEGYANLSIETREYKYTYEEFIGLEPTIFSQLVIRFNEPPNSFATEKLHISIDLKERPTIFSNLDTVEASGLTNKIGHLLNKHKRMLLGIPIENTIRYICIISFISVFLIGTKSNFIKEDEALSIFLLGIILMIFPSDLMRIRNIIIFDKKENRPNFWKRNKDAIIVGTTMTIIGAVIGIVLDRLSLR